MGKQMAEFEINCCECEHTWRQNVEENDNQEPMGVVECPSCEHVDGFVKQ